MAENKGITEVQALQAVRGLVATEVATGVDEKWSDVLDKIDHMIEVRSRKHDRKRDTSKRDANIEMGKRFEAEWDGGEFRIADVRDVLNVNTARAIAIARAMEWVKVPTTESVNVYTLG